MMQNEPLADARTNILIWKLCAYAGPVYLVGIMVSWGMIAKFFPPPLESWTPVEVAKFFTDNSIAIRIGMDGVLVSAGFYLAWSALISRIIRRIEGPDGVLASIELMGGVATTMAMMLFGALWLTAAFRVEYRAPEDIAVLHDMGWFIFNLTFMVTLLQFAALGTAILIDKRPVPLFPKWLGWLCYAAFTVAFCGLLTPFFRQGPFAWHGLISYYVALTPFITLEILTCYYVFGAVSKLEPGMLSQDSAAIA